MLAKNGKDANYWMEILMRKKPLFVFPYAGGGFAIMLYGGVAYSQGVSLLRAFGARRAFKKKSIPVVFWLPKFRPGQAHVNVSCAVNHVAN